MIGARIEEHLPEALPTFQNTFTATTPDPVPLFSAASTSATFTAGSVTSNHQIAEPTLYPVRNAATPVAANPAEVIDVTEALNVQDLALRSAELDEWAAALQMLNESPPFEDDIYMSSFERLLLN